MTTAASEDVSRLALALRDIKLAHTVFAMPFALLAAFVVAPGAGGGERIAWATFLPQLGLIAVCMFFARTWAMLVNRVADARFDRDNPRTASRAVASGKLSAKAGWTIAVASAGLFWGSAAGFLAFGNVWPALLAPFALGWIALYAYTKRFTALCHLFLGTALAISPICAAIAIDPGVFAGGFWLEGTAAEETAPRALVALALFITCWVAGFDIAYALADLEFDRRTGLHSIPAALGVRGALWAGRALHAAALVFLLVFVLYAPGLGRLSLVAAGAVGGLLVSEHVVLARRGVDGLPIAFFTVNGVISVVFGAVGILDTVFP